MFAKKPFKSGFKKALERLELKPEEVAVVGDQLFTDIIGARRMKMFPILVKPIDEKDIWITKVKRPIENKIIERYKRSQMYINDIHILIYVAVRSSRITNRASDRLVQ